MSSAQRPTLRVGIVGDAFMGKAHSPAWRNAARFFDLPLRPKLTTLCGRSTAVQAAVGMYGFAAWETRSTCSSRTWS